MPNCSRCIQDDKPCFYAKSRRGMRDRNAPRKRATMRESGKTSPLPSAAHNVYATNPLAFPVGGASSESYTGPPSDTSATGSPGSASSRINGRQADPRRLLDLYYKYALLCVFLWIVRVVDMHDLDCGVCVREDWCTSRRDNTMEDRDSSSINELHIAWAARTYLGSVK